MRETKFNLLEIDLTTGEKKVVDLTKDVKKYIGGRGLGAKILWDRVPEGTDPLSAGEHSLVWCGTHHRFPGVRNQCERPLSTDPSSGPIEHEWSLRRGVNLCRV